MKAYNINMLNQPADRTAPGCHGWCHGLPPGTPSRTARPFQATPEFSPFHAHADKHPDSGVT